MVSDTATPQVVLCGCGNIGFRHLQSLLLMQMPCDITVIEPNTAHHDRIESELRATNHAHRVTLGAAVSDAPAGIDLLIIATNAEHRFAAFSDFIAHSTVKKVFFEKVLFQTLGELDETQKRLDDNSIQAFVNCGRRGFGSYHGLKAELTDAPLSITVEGSLFGMASNSIHFLDLAEFLTGAALSDLDASDLRAGSVPTKRSGCVEVFGTLRARFDDGSSLTITCDDQDPVEIRITLQQGDKRIVIDELAGTITRDGAAQPFEVMRVSNMPYLYLDALTGDRHWLTPYTQSAHQHRHFLTAILRHLDITPSATACCPVS